jgi:hypothetical protein
VFNNVYDGQCSSSITVGSEQFVGIKKARLLRKALGRQIREVPGGYAHREQQSSYIVDSSLFTIYRSATLWIRLNSPGQ